MNDFLARFNSWFKKPFDAGGDAITWALFLIFVITVSVAWTRVLRHIQE